MLDCPSSRLYSSIRYSLGVRHTDGCINAIECTVATQDVASLHCKSIRMYAKGIVRLPFDKLRMNGSMHW